MQHFPPPEEDLPPVWHDIVLGAVLLLLFVGIGLFAARYWIAA